MWTSSFQRDNRQIIEVALNSIQKINVIEVVCSFQLMTVTKQMRRNYDYMATKLLQENPNMSHFFGTY
jgi:hypothetical protein